MAEIGTVARAFSQRSGKRKLRHEQNLSARLFYIEIHFVVLVPEHAQLCNLACKVVGLLFGVAFFYTQKYGKSRRNFAYEFAVYGQRGFESALYKCSHYFSETPF
jgi:hypothetical protein